MYSTCADVKMLQFKSSLLVPNIIRMAFSDICQKAKTLVTLVVCFSQQRELRWLTHIDIDQTLFQELFGSRETSMEEHVIVYARAYMQGQVLVYLCSW
jgi:hypothetical protein